MLFNSLGFLFVFLPIACLGVFTLSRYRVLFLGLISLVFYACWHLPDLGLLLASMGFNYIAGSALQRHKNKTILAVAIAINLLVIAWFKYFDFFAGTVNALFDSHLPLLHIILPLGVSFFTLHQITWLVDSYHGKIPKTKWQNYLLYITFFPQLIAGPIVRYTEVMHQYTDKNFGKFDTDRFTKGAFLFSLGLCKKVLLADYFATLATPLFDHAQLGFAIPAAEAWIGVLSYSFQIYFDFSAYSDMALGLGYLFGIALPLNFNSPYTASSIIDFWHRWHMTLSRFLRDYLYIPLGGNRHGATRRYLNLILVMLIGGLWHGAAWTFVIWGGLHGLYLLINHAWRAARPLYHETALSKTIYTVITFAAVALAWVFFRADSVPSALNVLQALTGDGAFDQTYDNAIFLMLILGASIIWLLPNSNQWTERFAAAIASPSLFWRISGLLIGALTGLAVFLTFTGVKSEFIYFQF